MDFPARALPAPPVLTTQHICCLGLGYYGYSTANNATSATWVTANKAFFYPFSITSGATIYQLLFHVGATSSGNIDVGVYDTQGNRIVSAGSTAMSATVNTVQKLNVTDTYLPAGDYLLAAACDNTTGTVLRLNLAADELALSSFAVYEQAGLTAAALPNPATPVLTTEATVPLVVAGIQFRSVF